MKKVRINIVSPGRFHVCDLARELDKSGWNVRFYSFVPDKRAVSFGLPKKCNKSVLVFIAPFLLLQKLINKQWIKQFRIYMQDIITGFYMRKCDVLIAMSGDFTNTVQRAKKEGSVIILERGSKHIIVQKRILDSIPSLEGTCPVPRENVKRELRDYQNADYIAIATQHVYKSFIEQNFDVKKLFINPYGVDLSMFSFMPNVQKEYDVIMVGGWSWRKGCDLIVDAIKKTNYTFLHVGGIVDLPFPSEKQFTHVPPVDQNQLVKYYNCAKIFILPSREEGLAMVQAQAIACNLPLVGSRDSGAMDLKEIVDRPEFITILKEYTPKALVEAMHIAMDMRKELKEELYAGDGIKKLTWEAYGKRYSAFLHKILNV